MNDPASAIVVELAVPPAIETLRRAHDPSARDGVPAHVTILYPFLPARRLDAGVRAALEAIAAEVDPFDVTFASAATWPATVYLVPEPAEPFRRLTERVVEAFPGSLPYGGAHDEIVPHLTIADRAGTTLDAIVVTAERALPFRARASAVDVLATEPGASHWARRWQIPLGVRR
jgi:2'-5' RNA ligase